MILFMIYMLITLVICCSQIMCLDAAPQKALQLYNALLKSSKLNLLIKSRLLATIIYNIYQLLGLKGLQLWQFWSKSPVIVLCPL